MRWGAVSLTSVENITIDYACPAVAISVNLTGDDGANRLVVEGSGYASNPIRVDISGGGGDDFIEAYSRDATLNGGDGNDTITGRGVINGDDGDDLLRSSDFGIVYGGRGNDRLESGSLMDGGEGDDFLEVGSIFFTDGIGGGGIDTLSFDRLFSFTSPDGVGVQINLATGQTLFAGRTATVSGVERVVGTRYNDIIVGDDNANTLTGGFGGDTLSGGGGADILNGDAGDDSLAVGAGDDVLSGGEGADTLDGGDGSDALSGGEGGDMLSGSAGNDVLDGGGGVDRLSGGDGDDRITGGLGSDTIDGGAGNDTAVFSIARSAASVSVQNGVFTIVSADGIDTLTAIEQIQFSDGVFDFRADGMVAAQPRRIITGTVNPEVLNGGDSNDKLDGGAGNDTLIGVLGNDTLTGGVGTDVAIFNYARGDATIAYQDGAIIVTGAEGRDVLTGIESLQFSDGVFDVENGTVFVVPRSNQTGTAAADILTSRAGGEVIDGGAGFDAVVYSGVVRQYDVRGGASTTVTGGPETGRDRLVSIEEARFVDGVRSFDVDGIAAQVMRLYDATLDRQPDQAGLDVQIRALATGATTLQGLADAFVASGEFQSRYGTVSNQQFVEQLYRFCLDREGDAPGIAVQVNALNTGTSRAALVVAFSESPEHRTLTQPILNAGLWIPDQEALQIARLYDATFDRLPDAPGLAAQVAALDAGTSLLTIAAGFAASAEFQDRYGALSNQAFVEQLYRFCLNREGDAPGIAAQVNTLNSGTSRAQLLLNFSESPEHVALTAPFFLGGIRTLDTFTDRLAGQDESVSKDEAFGPQVLPTGNETQTLANETIAKAQEAQVLPGTVTYDPAQIVVGFKLVEDSFVLPGEDGLAPLVLPDADPLDIASVEQVSLPPLTGNEMLTLPMLNDGISDDVSPWHRGSDTDGWMMR
ncbi:DUF4214 domain-containing protein [Brevundimonas variabilis]|uniref:Ca2+-binding RTX toxin-like protein n=1 Tax=Brevundimonas variabilis TaxID=74312 RepID=A0A7W9CLH2_9CAUL|nr:DUF4214 domain-containing protein [Brevundimonas variabilis]MBB5747591.1 Ca2+-binding RTX toxin-like protein [Brevundimonas variabilis]